MSYQKNSLIVGGACVLLFAVLVLLRHPQPAVASHLTAPSVAAKAGSSLAAPAATKPGVATQSTAAPAEITADQAAISSIIATPNTDPRIMVDQLLTLLPSLSESGQREAARHIANLSSDEDAARWTAALVKDSLPAPAADVLFKDLASRPSSIALPALAAMADNPNHPRHQDSADALSVLLGPAPASSSWTNWLSKTSNSSVSAFQSGG